MGNPLSRPTPARLAIRNHTEKNIVDMRVTGVDDFDFYKRPDHALDGKKIRAGEEIYVSIDVNKAATWTPFTTTLYYTGDISDSFRVNIYPVTKGGTGTYDFDVNSRYHQMTLTDVKHDHRLIVTIREKGEVVSAQDHTQSRTTGTSTTIGVDASGPSVSRTYTTS